MDSPDGNKSVKRHESGVTVIEYGTTTTIGATIDPIDWPDGNFIVSCLDEQKLLNIRHHQSDLCRDPLFWQACARKALLHKYGYLKNNLVDTVDHGKVTSGNVQSRDEIDIIQGIWTELISSMSDSVEEKDGSAKNDLIDFIESKCQYSNHRTMQWSGMSCQPGTQFKLHAHPNLELVYCAQGALHEIRMMGEAFTKDFERDVGDDSVVRGPNLTNIRRSWSFATLPEARWLVNEVGSIHKSFTSMAGTGCMLLALWGGSHANISDPPLSVNVEEAVNDSDRKLCRVSDDICKDDCTNWSTISAIFLPDNEK